MIRRVWIVLSKTWLSTSSFQAYLTTIVMAILFAMVRMSAGYRLGNDIDNSSFVNFNSFTGSNYLSNRTHRDVRIGVGFHVNKTRPPDLLKDKDDIETMFQFMEETEVVKIKRKHLSSEFPINDDKDGNRPRLSPSWVFKFSDDHIPKNISELHFKAVKLVSRLGEQYRFHGPVGGLKGHYLIVHDTFLNNSLTDRNMTVKQNLISRYIGDHSEIEWVRQEVTRKRYKRTLQFKDQFFPSQWHLDNLKFVGHDINVTGVWEHNITGKGVVVSVIDDGVEWSNPDILDNYSAEGSWDLNSNDADPMPRVDEAGLNHHGTRCAGEIAAVANEYCAVGVAYGARVSGVRILDGPMTDSLEAMAFNTKMDVNDVYSCSWGPDDNGKTVDGPHQYAQAALAHGVMAGRKGYGGIYVVASGNGGHFRDNCNFDGYANSIFTVTIGAVDELGQMPYYAEQCAAMLAVTYSSGQGHQRNIVTTDWRLGTGSGCTDRHTGTSAAAPLAAGIIALMLEVRPCLTWRDVQHIIVYTAVKVNIDEEEWHRNGAGFPHSHKHGFGLLNTWRLVTSAKVWPAVPYLTSWSSPVLKVHTSIPIRNKPLIKEFYVSSGMANDVLTLEHVTVTVNINHRCRGTLTVQLLSPSGTKSKLATPRKYDRSTEGFVDWTFSTVRCWGERPQGVWKLIVVDTAIETMGGVLKDWRLTFYGSSITPTDILERKRLVQNAWSGKYLSIPGPPCLPPPSPVPTSEVFSSRMMKVLFLLSGFFALIGTYTLLEVVCRDICSKDNDGLKDKAAISPESIDFSTLVPNGLTEQDQARLHVLLEQGDHRNPIVSFAMKNQDIEKPASFSAPVTPDEVTRITEFENRLNFALEQSVALQAKQMHQIEDLERELFLINDAEGLGPADVILETGKKPKKPKLKGILKKPKQYKE